MTAWRSPGGSEPLSAGRAGEGPGNLMPVAQSEGGYTTGAQFNPPSQALGWESWSAPGMYPCQAPQLSGTLPLLRASGE